MSIFKNKNFNFSNFGPQHPAVHGVLCAMIFTKGQTIKNIINNRFLSNNSLVVLNNNYKKESKISKVHINEFLTIINSFKKNPRQSRLINSYEIIDNFNNSKRGYNKISIAYGIWFQNSETGVWSVLEFEEITGNFQNPQNGVFLGLMTFKIKDISDLPAYNFLYNNKTYRMDGTISYDSMNEIINKIDSNLVLKFLENVLEETNLITDFDKFVTVIILSNHVIKVPNGNPSRLCGIILPALFSNKARYQIYTAPTIYIQPYKDKNDLRNPISKSLFQIPAPVSENIRVPYYDDCPGDEINLDGSIPFEAIDIKLSWNPEFQQNFDFMKSLAEIQNIKHINLDWIIFMLLSKNELSFFKFEEIQKLKELTSEDISNSIGYHLPVYYCLMDYNEFFKKAQFQYLKRIKNNKKYKETLLKRVKSQKESEPQCLKTENSHLSLWERIQLNRNKKKNNNKKLSNSLIPKRFMFSVPELLEVSQQISRREPIIIRVWITTLGSRNPRPIIFNSDGGFITKNLPIQSNKEFGLNFNVENQQKILESLQTVITLDNKFSNTIWKVGNDRVVFPISGITIQDIIQSSFESISRNILNDLIEEAILQNSTVVIDIFNSSNVKITKLQTPHFFAELSKGIYTSNEGAIQSLGENFVTVNTLIQDSGIINCREWPNYARGVEIQTISEIETVRETQIVYANDHFFSVPESSIVENLELELLISKYL